MSKASARHKKQGKDNRKFAQAVANKKQARVLKQRDREVANEDKIIQLGIVIRKGETPSRALRRYRREQDGARLSEARAAEEAQLKALKDAQDAFMRSLSQPINRKEA
jgi:hypothetical protein